ncbi:MAG: D-alanine--D-alanine ligase, partial [Planctomycetota bacterium]
RILVLVHESLVPPDSMEGLSDAELDPVKTEYDVTATLRNMGHDARPLGVGSDLGVINKAVDEFKPHVAFNLLEEFAGVGVFDAHVASYLEMLGLPYTGCNPRGLMLGHNKAISKMICRYHRIPVPRFHVFQLGHQVRRPKRLAFPLLVKSLTEEGSIGISQASIVRDDEQLAERVAFVHRTVQTDAIAEQYIAGREFYIGVLGNQRLQTLPLWELTFEKLRDDAPKIATARIKWDTKYRKQIGIDTGPAKDVPDPIRDEAARLAKRAFRSLQLSGYARMDLRLSDAGRLYLLEANPNPEIAYGEDLAESAHAAGIDYEALLHKVLSLGMGYRLRGQV